MIGVPVLAVGRSGLFFDAVAALARSERYRVAAIVTDDAYPEYDVGVEDFAELAVRSGAEFHRTSALTPGLATDLIQRHKIQIGISANWRYVISPAVLASVPRGILNLHLGRLPDYKGNATANWAILAGESEIFADVHVMVAELDAGDVLARAGLPLTDRTYIGEILAWARGEAPALFLAAADSAMSSGPAVVPGSATGLRCYPRLPEDGAIDWRQPAVEICRLVRASSRPYPGAFTRYRDQELTVWRASVAVRPSSFLAVPGQVLHVDRSEGTIEVACGSGALRLEEIEIDGRPIAPAEAVRGLRTRLDTRAETRLPAPARAPKEDMHR